MKTTIWAGITGFVLALGTAAAYGQVGTGAGTGAAGGAGGGASGVGSAGGGGMGTTISGAGSIGGAGAGAGISASGYPGGVGASGHTLYIPGGDVGGPGYLGNLTQPSTNVQGAYGSGAGVLQPGYDPGAAATAGTGMNLGMPRTFIPAVTGYGRYPAGAEVGFLGNVGTSQGTLGGDDQWRFRNHGGNWWYWLPSNRWLVYANGNWVEYSPNLFAGRIVYGDTGFYNTGPSFFAVPR